MDDLETNQFCGVLTALATPFAEGKVSFADLGKLVRHQIDGGVQGLVAVGTTGESPTLNHGEHHEVIQAVADLAAGRVPVLAGTGSNSTAEAVELTGRAHAIAGVTGMLAVAPYYNKPNPAGLRAHFSAMAEATDKPIILYSIPGRCGIEIDVETCAYLRERYPHVCGIKEAGGRSARVIALRQELGPDYLILSGDDGLTLPFMACGAKGVISVASNVAPREMSELVGAALENNFASALVLADRFQSLFDALFCEPNPVPVKHALVRLGILSSPEVRLPLTLLSEASATRVNNALATAGLMAIA